MPKLSRCMDSRKKRGCCPDRMDFFGSIGRQGCGNWKGEVKEHPLTVPTCVMPCRNFKAEEEECGADPYTKRMIKAGCGCQPKYKGKSAIPKDIDGFPICQMQKYEQNDESSEMCDCANGGNGGPGGNGGKKCCKPRGSNGGGGYYYQPVDYENIELQHVKSESCPSHHYQNCQSTQSAHHVGNFTQSCSQSDSHLNDDAHYSIQHLDPNFYHSSAQQSCHPPQDPHHVSFPQSFPPQPYYSPQSYNMPSPSFHPSAQNCQSSAPKPCKQSSPQCQNCQKSSRNSRSASQRTGTGQPSNTKANRQGANPRTMYPMHKHACQGSSRPGQQGTPSHQSICQSNSQTFIPPCPRGPPCPQTSGQGPCQPSGQPCSQSYGQPYPQPCPPQFGPRPPGQPCPPCSPSSPSLGQQYPQPCGQPFGQQYPQPGGQPYGQSYPQSSGQQSQYVMPVSATILLPVEPCCCCPCPCPMMVVCSST